MKAELPLAFLVTGILEIDSAYPDLDVVTYVRRDDSSPERHYAMCARGSLTPRDVALIVVNDARLRSYADSRFELARNYALDLAFPVSQFPALTEFLTTTFSPIPKNLFRIAFLPSDK